MAKEYLPKEGEPHREIELACELDPDDAGGIPGIKAPLSLSPQQSADLRGMIRTGEVDPGVDMLDIEGDEITEEKLIELEEVNLAKLPTLYIDHVRVGAYIRNTLSVDKNNSREDSLIDIYRVMRPGEPPILDTADALFQGLFFVGTLY